MKTLYEEYRETHPDGYRHASFGNYLMRYRMVGHEEIWYATNGELYRYKTAAGQLMESADGARVENPTGVPIWILKDGEVQVLRGTE